MPDLLVKGITPKLHRRLKDASHKHHRSMNKEAIAILEQNLLAPILTVPKFEPFKGPFPLTDAWLEKAVKSGRT